MKIGYLRVSTEEQRPDRQVDGLKGICDEVYIEKISAVSKKRIVFEKVIKKLKSGDTFVVWDLDRAFRSTVDALLEAEKLKRRGVEFQIVTLHIDTSTPAGELIYTVMAAFAQFERQNLVKRTKEGMAAAKRRGKHVGRPFKFTDEQIRIAHAKIFNDKSTLAGAAKNLNCARDTLARSFKRLGLESIHQKPQW
jgi:DNA invertase Pin-like site-specific DNA recombinase